ncbi:MAG TPA: PIG-L deacetylase family protein [Mycobacteriales bacterium]|nr:PIG-L deacetylase family protein [Mycobacteriales bacterium]
MLADNQVERALVITAHPDDVDFGAAGTIAQWTDAGIDVTYCVITDGDAGGFDPAVPRSDIGGIRQAEQRAAAKEAGVSEVLFLGYGDGRLQVSFELRRDLSRVIREVRPQRVVCQSPERNMVRIPASHPDHLAAGEAALCAVYPDARNPFAYPELAHLDAWVVNEAWVMGREQSNRFVDITPTFDRKMAALSRHASQLPNGIEGVTDVVRMWNGANAKEGGLPEGRVAEAFWVIEIGG